MSNNSYNDFKNGIKSDVKETGIGLLLIGGVVLLACVLLGALTFAIQDTTSDSSTRFLVGGVSAAIILLMIFNRTARTRIAQFWIIVLVAIPLLFLVYIVLCMFYVTFTQSFK